MTGDMIILTITRYFNNDRRAILRMPKRYFKNASMDMLTTTGEIIMLTMTGEIL